jgi:flagellar protein FliS
VELEEVIVAYASVSSAYRETRIKTASQGQLIVMLYDAVVKQLDKGLELLRPSAGGQNTGTGRAGRGNRKLAPGSIEKIGKNILKAQEIITELMVSLDFDAGGEIARNLFSLYTWFNQELLEANISHDARRILVVRNMVDDLRGAWSEASAKTAAAGMERPLVGVNIAG